MIPILMTHLQLAANPDKQSIIGDVTIMVKYYEDNFSTPKSSAITACSMLTLINHHKMNFGSSARDLKGDTQIRSGHLCQVLLASHS